MGAEFRGQNSGGELGGRGVVEVGLQAEQGETLAEVEGQQGDPLQSGLDPVISPIPLVKTIHRTG
jgi:hypothetical protein